MITKETIRPERVLSQKLQAVPEVVHGFSTRQGGVSAISQPGRSRSGGDLNLGYSEHDAEENVRTNRKRWLRALSVDDQDFRFVLLRQEHSKVIHTIRNREEAADDFTRPGTLQGDGLITDVPGVLLTVQTADCVPVLLCDPVRRAVGAFHAGWRGTLARIVEHAIESMQELYGTKPADIIAAIGPSIGPESYIVSTDLLQQFAAEFDYAAGLSRKSEQQTYFDLWEANHQQLLRAGVPANNIDVTGMDTAADTTRFFSYRAEHGRTGRMMSSIGLQP